jgi:hypothetical protein
LRVARLVGSTVARFAAEADSTVAALMAEAASTAEADTVGVDMVVDTAKVIRSLI